MTEKILCTFEYSVLAYHSFLMDNILNIFIIKRPNKFVALFYLF